MDRLGLGAPGREEELENVLELLRTMGRLGIHVWCYNWMAVVPWSRTSTALPTRGGATATGFDLAIVGRRPGRAGSAGGRAAAVGDARAGSSSGSSRWRRSPACGSRCTQTIRRCRRLRGIGRIIRTIDAYDRVFELPAESSERHDDVPGERRLDDGRPSRGDSALREPTAGSTSSTSATYCGTQDGLVETFVDDGPTDMAACIRAYLEGAVDAPLRTDHSPALTGGRRDHARVSRP